MVRKSIMLLASLALLVWTAGCTFVSKATVYNGLPGQHGKPVEFYGATSVGVSLLFFLPVLGEPTVPATLGELTAKVKDDGGTNVRVISTGTSYLWYVFFPITIFIHPVITSVTADAEFMGPSAVEKKTAAASERREPARERASRR